MTDLETKLRNFLLIEHSADEEFINQGFRDSRTLASIIAGYAHRNQKRINGETYYAHPHSVAKSFRRLLCTGRFDGDLLEDLDIPFWGVEELCYLHDVVEDTDIDIEEIKELFDQYASPVWLHSFDTDIKDALIAITHKKGEPYEEYFARVLANEKASLVKMLDIQDNLMLLNYEYFNDEAKERTLNYVNRFYQIDQKYHWLARIKDYQNRPHNIYDDWADW